MRRFAFTVVESRPTEIVYVVEAMSLDEAVRKALIGDVVEETFVREYGVTGREILEWPAADGTKPSFEPHT